MFYFFLAILLLFCIYCLYKKRHKATYYNLDAKQRQIKLIFDNLYKNTNGAQLSKQDRGNTIKDAFSLVYGEIVFDSFTSILAKAEINTGEIFYDLGSGTGKAVIAAALLYDFSKCIGIEILPALYQSSLEKLNTLPSVKTVQFIQHDFFNYDFSDAHIVFINATGFFGESYNTLVQILKKLKHGTRIIISSKLLPSEDFELKHQEVYLMSWGFSRVSIYLKTA